MSEWLPFENVYARVLASAWMDPERMRKLRRDPKQALLEQGVNIPEGTNVVVSEKLSDIYWEPGNPSTLALPLPPRPEGLTDEHLDAGAAQVDTLLCVSPCCSCCCG